MLARDTLDGVAEGSGGGGGLAGVGGRGLFRGHHFNSWFSESVPDRCDTGNQHLPGTVVG